MVVEGDAWDGGGVDRVDDGLNNVRVDRNANAEPVQQESLFYNANSYMKLIIIFFYIISVMHK